MSQEQRDSYVIPPNFIEGGSFFGGLFKARNVVCLLYTSDAADE